MGLSFPIDYPRDDLLLKIEEDWIFITLEIGWIEMDYVNKLSPMV